MTGSVRLTNGFHTHQLLEREPRAFAAFISPPRQCSRHVDISTESAEHCPPGVPNSAACSPESWVVSTPRGRIPGSGQLRGSARRRGIRTASNICVLQRLSHPSLQTVPSLAINPCPLPRCAERKGSWGELALHPE